jgi:hypothetical protein
MTILCKYKYGLDPHQSGVINSDFYQSGEK